MTNATREALIELVNANTEVSNAKGTNWQNKAITRQQAAERAAHAALSQPEAEPVAWRYQARSGWGKIWRVSEFDPLTPGFFETPDIWRVEPLYTAPPASADMRVAFMSVHASMRLAMLQCKSIERHRGGDKEIHGVIKYMEAALANAQGKESEGGGQDAPAKCSATGARPTDTSCAAEPEVAPGPSDPTPPDRREAPEGLPFGIIDPDYARFFTEARLACWSYGYALAMHGSFTRDLDLIAMPWTETACDADKLIQQIEYRTEWKRLPGKECSHREHGRMVWTLTSPKFNCARFVDFSVVPRILALTSGGR